MSGGGIAALFQRDHSNALLDKSFDRSAFLSLIFGLSVIYVLSKWLYNLFLHPLKGIPGPKIAAMSSLYEFWFDVVLDGRYIFEIEKMHNKYGELQTSIILFYSHLITLPKAQ